MADAVDDIKARLSIVDVVSPYVQLKKAGVNHKGLCPFHSEKTPSFVVSPEKQICHCFGCNKGGDIFTFVQEVESVTFPEALQILADRAGITIENISKYQNKEGKNEKDEYYKAHDLACEFFEKELKGKEGKKVMDYLKKRGLTDDTIKEFRIGFAPDSYDKLHKFLLKKGISKRVLTKSGLATSKSVGGDNIYDKYRTRLMFPIFDFMGRVCGFGGRALKKDQMPKYLNSPENIIYSKSKVLYGFSHSKRAVKETGKVVVVEGYFDVILPYQSGIKNVVASSGTALTEDQGRLIKRVTKEVVTCFDADSAGFEATKRAYFVLNAQDINVKTIAGLNAKDPADFIVEKGDFQKLVDDAPNFLDYYIEKLVAEGDMSNYDSRAKVINEILPVYKQLSPSAKDHYVRQFASKLKIDERALYDEIDRYKLPTNHPAREEQGNVKNEKMSFEDIFVALLLERSQLFENVEKIIEKNDLSGDSASVYKELDAQYNAHRQDFEGWDEKKGFLADVRAKTDVLKLYAEELYGEFSDEACGVELEKLIDKIKKDRKTQKLRKIEMGIVEAEEAQDKSKLLKLLEEQQTLLSEQK
jgi:DNA primase